MPTDLNAATIVTTIDAGDYAIFVTSAGNAIKILKANLLTEILGDNVTEADLDKLADITASAAEVNVLDGVSGSLVVSDVNILAGQAAAGLTGTELGYVNGVTSPIQTQINNKANTTSLSFRPYLYQKSFAASGTSETITNSTILTAVGLSSSTHYIIASGLVPSLADHVPGVNALAVDIGTNFRWSEGVVSGSIYEVTNVQFLNLTSTQLYSIGLCFLVKER